MISGLQNIGIARNALIKGVQKWIIVFYQHIAVIARIKKIHVLRFNPAGVNLGLLGRRQPHNVLWVVGIFQIFFQGFFIHGAQSNPDQDRVFHGIQSAGIYP